jgi:hypothetical protein
MSMSNIFVPSQSKQREPFQCQMQQNLRGDLPSCDNNYLSESIPCLLYIIQKRNHHVFASQIHPQPGAYPIKLPAYAHPHGQT